MKLQKILELTRLSKKAVYFYIKEGLIEPTKNIDNGYYEFSEEDLRKLKIIISLRNIGMSIQDIKDLFFYPTLTNFFIHRQINNIKKSLYENISQLQTSYQLIEDIPANATPKNLEIPLDILERQKISNDLFLEKYFPNVDSRMIAILLCAPFTDIESSEYHNFLWEKISNELELQLENNLSYLKKLIYLLTPEQIEKTSIEQYKFSKKIANITKEEFHIYEEELYNRCLELANNVELQKYWKLVYDPILIPTLHFFINKGSKLLGEYNPIFKRYSDNMDKIAQTVYMRIKEEDVLEKLNLALDNKFDIEMFNHSQFICIYTFRDSMFTQVKLDVLKELLNEEN